MLRRMDMFDPGIAPVDGIRAGIGGWTYAPWRDNFYPKGLVQRRELEFASRRLSCIEINGTYYGTQKPAVYAKWRDETPPGFIFTSAVLEGIPADKESISEAMKAVTEHREASQPIKARTGGSTFQNPAGHSAWKLIDAAGCRGFKIGDAQVSEMHCNFLINTGTATAADLEGLGEEVRRRVLETTGVALRWEIRRIGVPAADPRGEDGR